MGATGVMYTFTFTISQPLSSSCSFSLIFPADISLTVSNCTISVNNGIVSNVAFIPSSTILSFNYSSSPSAPFNIGDTFTIIVNGLTNPLLPQTFNFGLKTYYSSI